MLHGIAWDGGFGIRGVDVSIDGGASWRAAKLGRNHGRYSWRQWHFSLAPSRPGTFTVMVRASARDGSAQPDALIRNPAGYHHNVVQRAHYHVV